MRAQTSFSLEYIAALATEHPERLTVADKDRLLASPHVLKDETLRETLRQQVRAARGVTLDSHL